MQPKPIRHRHGLKGLRSAPQNNDEIKIKSYTHHFLDRQQYENEGSRPNGNEAWRQNEKEPRRQYENEGWRKENKHLIMHKSEIQDWRQNENEVIKLDNPRDDISLTSDNSLDPDTLKGNQSRSSYQMENTDEITDLSPRHLGHGLPRRQHSKRSHYNDDNADNHENPLTKTDTESNPLDQEVNPDFSHLQGHGMFQRQHSRSRFSDGDKTDKVDNKDIVVTDVIDIKREERLYKQHLELSSSRQINPLRT